MTLEPAGAEVSDDEFIEVPVTRRARVTHIGSLDWSRSFYAPRIVTKGGDDAVFLGHPVRFVLRAPGPVGSPFRAGFGQAFGDRVELAGIPAAADGDLAYRVEPA